jgi:hypothetical protein
LNDSVTSNSGRGSGGAPFSSPCGVALSTVDGSCEVTDCNTTSPSAVLQYNAPAGGQYYVQVTGGDSLNGSASGVQSTTPYSLVFEYPKSGALGGNIVTASFDNDLISFDASVRPSRASRTGASPPLSCATITSARSATPA